MKLPRKIPYHIKTQTVAPGFLICAGIAAAMLRAATHFQEVPPILAGLGPKGAAAFYFFLGVGSALGCAGCLLFLIQRCFFRPYLEMTQDELVLPYGLFRHHFIRIPYSTVRHVWEIQSSSQAFLKVSSNTQQVTIASGLLPNQSVYREIRDFLVPLESSSG